MAQQCANTLLKVSAMANLRQIGTSPCTAFPERAMERVRHAATAADTQVRQSRLDGVVMAHLWLADSLARRFAQHGQDDQDLLQVARLGLVEAARRYRPERGDFLPFAAATIRGTIKHHFRDHGWGVRPSRQSQELAVEIRREWSSLAQTLGAIPSERDLAARLGSTLSEVRVAQQASLGYICRPLDTAAEPQAGMSTGGEEVDRLEARLVVAQIWGELADSEQELLRLRFYEQRSQAEIAGILGTSQMQVSRLLTRLLAKLRAVIDADAELTLAS
jgi:RNA polymerase sigma-B factor